MDGAILDWLDHRDMSRTELRDLLLGALAGLGDGRRSRGDLLVSLVPDGHDA